MSALLYNETISVSYTHLDVYKRQREILKDCRDQATIFFLLKRLDIRTVDQNRALRRTVHPHEKFH